MGMTSLGITLQDRDTIQFHTSRSEELAWVAVRADESQCEIRMGRAHVEALRDQIPDVLAGLDRVVADDAACERAEIAGERTTDWAAKALDTADAAEEAGAHEVASSLRVAAVEATATANGLDAVLRALVEATLDADRATDRMIYAIHRADSALDRLRDRPASPVPR